VQVRLPIAASLIVCVTLSSLSICKVSSASDYFLTLGGGYAPSSNQASLEANVLFFQQLLSEQQLANSSHHIYFADGFDDQHDLQVLNKKARPVSSVVRHLSDIFRIPYDEVIYRNHQVPHISGGLRSVEIREGLNAIGSQMQSGDRLFIYVTSHGGAARGSNKMNTSITCWGNKPLAMKDFSRWLDDLPGGVEVISVMAQCYCGGFANMVFKAGDLENGIAENTRIGFYAQQADLPAAGCRPDIDNDEEYSSYFWGAFLGRSRTGKATGVVDCDQNGHISLAEAHAYAVVASNTIDIPLRTSDLFLRCYSRIAGYEVAVNDRLEQAVGGKDGVAADDASLAYMTGTIYELAGRGRPDETRMIVGLSEKLGIAVSSTIAELTELYEQQRRTTRDAKRSDLGSRRGRGPGSGGIQGPGPSSRRRLMATILEKWPELEDPQNWSTSPLLSQQNLANFSEELAQVPGFKDFSQGQEEREKARERATEEEIREVKFRRLLQQLESIVLAQNLPLVASPEIVERFHAVRSVEESFLSSVHNNAPSFSDNLQ
jgi:hypothetical protein